MVLKLCLRITWKACKNTDSWASLQIKYVCGTRDNLHFQQTPGNSRANDPGTTLLRCTELEDRNYVGLNLYTEKIKCGELKKKKDCIYL